MFKCLKWPVWIPIKFAGFLKESLVIALICFYFYLLNFCLTTILIFSVINFFSHFIEYAERCYVNFTNVLKQFDYDKETSQCTHRYIYLKQFDYDKETSQCTHRYIYLGRRCHELHYAAICFLNISDAPINYPIILVLDK